MIENFTFLHPYFLLLLLPFLLLDILFTKKEQYYYIPHFTSLLQKEEKKSYVNFILKYLMLLALVSALASPVLQENVKDSDKHTLDIVLSLDTSGSMSLGGFNEENYAQSRWSVVQEVAGSFIQTRSHDRVSIVVFGDSSYIASTLSDDLSSSLATVAYLYVGIVGKSTALIDSIVSASLLLHNSPSSSKFIILLSDGDDSASKTPLEIALKIAQKEHIKIYTIAIGHTNNNILKLLAKETKAKSFTAFNKHDLEDVYRSIAKQEASTTNSSWHIQMQRLFIYPLALTLLFALIIAFLQRKEASLW